ncbi:hypothetical protein ACFL1Y_01500 [Patescibacteria group bacterium]
MKKLIVLTMIFAMSISLSGVAAAGNVGVGEVDTSLLKDTSGGVAPIVKVKWEANIDRYTDDSLSAGAQFDPSGHFEQNKTITICAIVTDPDGLADIDSVYADVFYPENIELGDSHVALPGQSGEGCGELMQEDKMTVLTKQDGINLFCNLIRNDNPNLPEWLKDPSSGLPVYDYDEICAQDGELWKDTAAVYCAEKDLSYEDPSGEYIVWALAQDTNGKQTILENSFTYLPMTAFETDFTSVNYGSVRLNTHKIISGDLTWDALNMGGASVRNVGNTRLQMGVQQDDMGLGYTEGSGWNVIYDARVGSNVSFANYSPDASIKYINDELDLSEMDEMDFSVLINKFPPTHETDSYIGNMTLSARSRAHLLCTD